MPFTFNKNKMDLYESVFVLQSSFGPRKTTRKATPLVAIKLALYAKLILYLYC